MSISISTYDEARKQVEKYALIMEEAKGNDQTLAYHIALEKFSDAMSKLVSLSSRQTMKSNYSTSYYGSGNFNASQNSSYQGLCGTAGFYGIHCGTNGGSEGLNW